MKTKSSGGGAMFMKRRVPELCHFDDSSSDLAMNASYVVFWALVMNCKLS